MVFHTFFNFSLNLAVRSSWSEPQSAPGLVFVDCIELLHLWLQRIESIWFRCWPSGEVDEPRIYYPEWSKSEREIANWQPVAVEFCQENALVIANTLFQQHKRRLNTCTSPVGKHWNQIDYILCSQRWGNYTVSKNMIGSWLRLRSWTPYCQIQTEIEENRENH